MWPWSLWVQVPSVTPILKEDMEDDICIFCGADLGFGVRHRNECSVVTNVYFLDPESFPDGLLCGSCGENIEDVYCLKETKTPDVKIMLCIGCEVLSGLDEKSSHGG